ncbi:glycosyltransferase family 2 protein [Epilithonimonas pallida]|uniref:Glycosyltransferase involved in cell wall bisynthesis n=1 Tax=Epilithonimonas pallida TaxID=373671 RepID=A0ABY1R5C4_9FLAO|nr:glycosyltransferase family 2 protein [Epilithonimonas pallida]SMP96130.1 Glycosyltransferase involved in cell wall bisynthesis [Epilithonimonas pallida]
MVISLIVPVYNVSLYLKRCIESILVQDFNTFELILVNDGSTDNSLDICKHYANQDSRIRVIDQPNGGVSNARNKGLEVANGEFICFIDSDDWVEPNYLSSFVSFYQTTYTDLIISNVVNQKNNSKTNNKPFVERLIQSESFVPEDFFNGNDFILENTPFAKLFKKSIIDDNNIRFNINLKNGEDFIFVLQYALVCKKIDFINSYTYNYNKESDSSVTQKYFKNYYKQVKDTKKAYFDIVRKYHEITEEEELYQYFRVAGKSVYEEGKINNGLSFSEKYKSILQILSKPEIKKYRENYRLKKDSSPFFYIIQKLVFYNQAFLLTIILNLHFRIIKLNNLLK